MFNRKIQNILFSLILTSIALISCQKDDSSSKALKDSPATPIGYRSLNPQERAADFDQLLSLFKTYYAPYSYKERRFGYNIESLAKELKEKAIHAKSDDEFMGYIAQFTAALKDGHVSFQREGSDSNIRAYNIPILLASVEDKVLISGIDDDLGYFNELAIGDEILSIDSQNMDSILTSILKYISPATELSRKQQILYAFYRLSYMTELIPKNSIAKIEYKSSSDNLVRVAEIPWSIVSFADTTKSLKSSSSNVFKNFERKTYQRSDFNKYMDLSGLNSMGTKSPFFITPQSKGKYQFIPANLSQERLEKVGLISSQKNSPIKKIEPIPNFFAQIYKFKGKNILLIRVPDYSADENFRTADHLLIYKALLQEYQPLVDGLILDQTHNPGGSSCNYLYEFFAKPKDIHSVYQLRADRDWLNSLLYFTPNALASDPNTPEWYASKFQAWGRLVEQAYDAGHELAEAVPLVDENTYSTGSLSIWKKPFIVLADELSGSCADEFPSLVQSNKRAPIFGQQTMGLGGTIGLVGTLNHSRISLYLTRSLFYPYNPTRSVMDSDYIENNGVLPDILYKHTVEDVRSGFIEYINAFSDALIKEIETKKAEESANPQKANKEDGELTQTGTSSI